MNLDDRARKAAAAVHESVRDVTPARVPARGRMRPAFRYAPSFAIIALIVAGVVLVRTIPDRTTSAFRLGSLQARINVADPLNDIHAITYASGDAWVLNSSRAVLTRIDARTNDIVARIDVGPDPSGIAIGFGAAWVSNFGDGTISRVDLKTNKATTINVQSPAKGVAVGEGSVWVATVIGEIVRVDPATQKVIRRYKAGHNTDSVALGGGYVWIGSYPDGIVRLDPQTGATKLILFSTDGQFMLRVTRDGKTLWATGNNESSEGIYRIDPSEDIPLPGLIPGTNGGFLEVFGGEVWGLSLEQEHLVRLDADTGRVRERFRAPSSVVGMAVGANSVWITTVQGTVLRYSLG